MKKTPKENLLDSRLIENVIVRPELEKRLAARKKLRIKIGMDPTAPDLHLGHAVALRLLKKFQDAGHAIIFVIGDYTARIAILPADQKPGRSSTPRPSRPTPKPTLSRLEKFWTSKNPRFVTTPSGWPNSALTI